MKIKVPWYRAETDSAYITDLHGQFGKVLSPWGYGRSKQKCNQVKMFVFTQKQFVASQIILEVKILLLFGFLLVDADEIKRLGKRFKKLDLDNSGSLSVEEFMSLPELQQNPLVQRVIDIFDTDGNGEVDFKGKERHFVF